MQSEVVPRVKETGGPFNILSGASGEPPKTKEAIATSPFHAATMSFNLFSFLCERVAIDVRDVLNNSNS